MTNPKAPTANKYTAGLIILAAAPCTAMVFVWSYLTDGDGPYTLAQVAINDLIMVFAFAPIVMFLVGVTGVRIPGEIFFHFRAGVPADIPTRATRMDALFRADTSPIWPALAGMIVVTSWFLLGR